MQSILYKLYMTIPLLLAMAAILYAFGAVLFVVKKEMSDPNYQSNDIKIYLPTDTLLIFSAVTMLITRYRTGKDLFVPIFYLIAMIFLTVRDFIEISRESKSNKKNKTED